jgi:hypothetical protein
LYQEVWIFDYFVDLMSIIMSSSLYLLGVVDLGWKRMRMREMGRKREKIKIKNVGINCF